MLGPVCHRQRRGRAELGPSMCFGAALQGEQQVAAEKGGRNAEPEAEAQAESESIAIIVIADAVHVSDLLGR